MCVCVQFKYIIIVISSTNHKNTHSVDIFNKLTGLSIIISLYLYILNATRKNTLCIQYMVFKTQIKNKKII